VVGFPLLLLSHLAYDVGKGEWLRTPSFAGKGKKKEEEEKNNRFSLHYSILLRPREKRGKSTTRSIIDFKGPEPMPIKRPSWPFPSFFPSSRKKGK